MYKRVMVLEINEDYSFAIEEDGGIIRINLKDNLRVGDTIYVLPEDLYNRESHLEKKKIDNGNSSPGVPHFREHWPLFAGLAAMLILCLALFIPQAPVPVYAEISIDGSSNLQLKVDDDYRILNAQSPDGTVTETLLESLEGKLLVEAGEQLHTLCGNGSILLSYALAEGKAETDEKLIQELRNIFNEQTIIILSGRSEDIKKAEQQSRTLGPYLADKYRQNEELDDVLEDLTLQELNDMLIENPKWMNNSDFREAIKEKKNEKKQQNLGAVQNDDDEDEIDERDSHNDDNDDDDYDTDEDDDDKRYSNRQTSTSQSSSSGYSAPDTSSGNSGSGTMTSSSEQSSGNSAPETSPVTSHSRSDDDDDDDREDDDNDDDDRYSQRSQSVSSRSTGSNTPSRKSGQQASSNIGNQSSNPQKTSPKPSAPSNGKSSERTAGSGSSQKNGSHDDDDDDDDDD